MDLACFFGIPGLNNDLNVVERSTLFNDLALGRSTPVQFDLGGYHYTHGYYLGDGIYLKWSTIVKTMPHPLSSKQRLFAREQESQRKDVERAFGVLQARFAMISRPCRLWECNEMTKIMFTCIILHNMIIKDERGIEGLQIDYERAHPPPEVYHEDTLLTDEDLNVHINNQLKIQNSFLHDQLQKDLMNHI